jgi:hypothetical protein
MAETTQVKLSGGPEMEKLFSITGQDESFLIPWLHEKYKSYFEIRKLLEECVIAFHKEIESWA